MSNKLPSVTSDIPRDLRTFIDRLREVISSSGTDRFVTAQDLINGGLASVGTTGTLIPIKKGVIATPPAPKNLSTTGSVNAIFVEWDNPTYYGHDYTEVYSGGTDVIGDAVLLGFTPGVNYVDTIGPQQSRYYWARFINTEGTAGPFNAVNGTLGQTGIEVEHMLEVLTGAITETQLYQDLGDRIDLIDGASSLAGSVNARVQAEATARANAILNEASARNSAILAESTARANAILAEATARGAAITNEATTRQNADNSLASQITTITASVSGNAAAIQQEATTRANADSAEAALRVALAARVTDAETGLTTAQAAITTESTTRATADTAIASQITALTSTVGANTAAITTESTTRANADSALSQQITTLTATTAANTAAIQTEATTRADADSAEATARQTLAARVTNAETGLTAAQAAITTEATTRATADTATATQITALTSTVNANTAAITTESSTRATADSALSSQITALTATVGTNTAAISTEASTRATADSALSSQITTLSSTVGGNTTAIQQEASTRASQTGDLFAKYTVKIDTNGYVSGFGLASTANNATPFSDFIVRADRFSISSPTGPGITPVTPFIVSTTPQTIDGTTVPAGVYIDGAYIKGGTIKGSAIEAGTITGTKLIDVSANKITGAALAATSYIESAAYIPGTQGWKIHANGTAEFAAASIRGQLTAGQINTNGLIIRDTNGTPIFGSGYPISYSSISGTPTLGPLATASSISYTNVTGLGTLATQNSVSAANVSGLGSLATQSSVNWNTQITNVPGFGGFAFLNTITSANISTYIAGTAIGTAYIADAAITSAKILDGEVTNAKIGGAIQSTNYYPNYSGWKIDKSGSAEFNDITVRSGQVIGALMTATKINSYVGLYVQINAATPISTTNGPYYLNGDTNVPQYLIYQGTMPAPATAAHKIAAIVNVQALASNQTKDLAVLVLINAFISGQNIYASEQIAYNTNSGTYGICTNASGVTTNTYSFAVPCMIFVGGFNCAFTIQTIDGLAWGVR